MEKIEGEGGVFMFYPAFGVFHSVIARERRYPATYIFQAILRDSKLHLARETGPGLARANHSDNHAEMVGVYLLTG